MTRKPRHTHDQPAHPNDLSAEESGRSLIDRLRLRLGIVREHRRRNARLYRGGGWGLIMLGSVVAVAQIGLFVVGRLDTIRLSGTAEVRIVSTSVYGGSWFDQSPGGTYLHYTYFVDGTTYPGADFRRWFNVAAHGPKVCYDPEDPASHVLVEGDFQCGNG